MADTQIEGSSGKADNTDNVTKDDQEGIQTHDFGVGFNTTATMDQLTRNKALFEADRSGNPKFLIMPDPDLPGGPKTPEPKYTNSNSQITS